jgi:membrane-associated phospholipid phosphatase
MPPKNNIPAFFHLKNLWDNLRLYDKLSLGYLSLAVLVVTLSAKSLPIRSRVQLIHTIVCLIIIVLAHFTQPGFYSRQRRQKWAWLQFLRDWYPLTLFTFLLFGEFTHLANAIFSYWLEEYLLRFDLWLFGQPSHEFIANRVPQWGVELMAFAYWSYYPIIIGVTTRYYLAPTGSSPGTGETILPQYHAKPVFIDFMNRLCLTFYLCYVLFMLMPARSPRHVLSFGDDGYLAGGVFMNFVFLIQNYASVVGAAFPSSHVAVAWVTVMALRPNHRYLFWGLMPLTIALTVSVVILQYHYVLDAIGGVVVAELVIICWSPQLVSRKARIATEVLHSQKSKGQMIRLHK